MTLNYRPVPGLVEIREARGETTVVVDPARLVDAAHYLRDEHGFDFLADIAATDYLGWGGDGVSGYIGTDGGRDINRPMTQGFQSLPTPKPKRFSVSYHLLALRDDHARVRLPFAEAAHVGHRRARRDDGVARAELRLACFRLRASLRAARWQQRQDDGEPECNPQQKEHDASPVSLFSSIRRRLTALVGGCFDFAA
jgi:hypothetical protein